MDAVKLPKVSLHAVKLGKIGGGGGPDDTPPSFTPYGIGILLKDGTIVDRNDPRMRPAYTRDEIEGITFELSGMSVALCPDAPPSAYFCNGRTVCPEAIAVATATIASTQFNGQENTTILRNRLTADKTWAVNKAHSIVVNGKNCYLPSLGEIMAIWHHKAVIDELLTRCGCAALPVESYWSSSLATRINSDGEEVSDDPNAYLSYMYGIYGSGNWDGFNVQGLYKVLAIATL